MEKIKTKLTVALKAEEVTYINTLIDRDTAIDGIPHEGYSNLNHCPVCNSTFGATDKYCRLCGQSVRYIESKDIPL